MARLPAAEPLASEGCSSCPSAEADLGDLACRPGVLPLAFRVTPWDRFGCKDPRSLDAATARQVRCGERFGDSSCTPEMVVDGAEALVGSNRDAGTAAIAAVEKASTAGGADVAVTRGPDGLIVRVGAGAGRGRLMLVSFDREHRTAIGRGENAGRIVTDANVARAVRDLVARTDVPLALGEPAPAGRIIGTAQAVS